MAKYRNTKTVCDGYAFDSKAEANRWIELRLLERAGQIKALERQPVFVLAPRVRFSDVTRAKPALTYKPDFRYIQDGAPVIEDVKGGPLTTAFQIKRHLLKAIHNLDVKIIR